MNERPIRIVAKPRQDVDLNKLARVVIELAKEFVKNETPKTPPAEEPELN